MQSGNIIRISEKVKVKYITWGIKVKRLPRKKKKRLSKFPTVIITDIDV